MRDWEEIEPTKRKIIENNILAWGTFILLMVLVFALTGCQADKTARLQCIDGDMYSVHPQKVELIMEDNCDKGRINLKGE